MHPHEFPIDSELVRGLIEKQFPAWFNLPLKQVSSSGTDNALFKLGSDKVVRLPRIPEVVEHVDKEFKWLPKLAPFLSVPISLPLAKGIPSDSFPWPWSIYHWLEGTHPEVGNVSELFVMDLVTFLRELQKIDPSDAPICRRGVPLVTCDKETRNALKKLDGLIDIRAATKIWDEALKIPEWRGSPVWLHGDLMPGNLLIQEGRLSAVIDFGILGVGDPACDLIVAWYLLPDHLRDTFRLELGVDDATWLRGRALALSIALIALPYYKDTNPFLAHLSNHVIQEVIKE